MMALGLDSKIMYNKYMNFINYFKNKQKFVNLSFIIFFLLFPIHSSFADLQINLDGKIENPINVDSVNGLIKTILEGVIRIGIPIIALAIIYSGFLFIAARGKPEKIKEAKDALLYTVIGAAVLLGSWALAQLISRTVLAL